MEFGLYTPEATETSWYTMLCRCAGSTSQALLSRWSHALLHHRCRQTSQVHCTALATAVTVVTWSQTPLSTLTADHRALTRTRSGRTSRLLPVGCAHARVCVCRRWRHHFHPWRHTTATHNWINELLQSFSTVSVIFSVIRRNRTGFRQRFKLWEVVHRVATS